VIKFIFNAARIAWGSGLSQAITLLSMPIMARLFTPAQFGAFGVFFLGSQLLGATLAGRYEQAIMIAGPEKEATALAALSVALAAVLAAAALPFSILFMRELDQAVGLKLGWAWPAMVVTGLFVSIFTTTSVLAIRTGDLNEVSWSRLAKTLVSTVVQMGLGLVGLASSWALVTGEALAACASALLLAWVTAGAKSLGDVHSWLANRSQVAVFIRYTGVQARRHIDFVAINLPHTVFNAASGLLTTVLIASIFSPGDAGSYFMMQRIAFLPASLFGAAMSQIYFQAASEASRETSRFDGLLVRTTGLTAAIGSAVALPLLVAGPTLFRYVLGEHWRVAGTLAQLLAPYVAVHLTLSTLAPTPIVGRKLRWAFAVNVIQNLLFVGVFLCVTLWTHSISSAVAWAGGASIPFMLCVIGWYWQMSRGESGRESTA
jgi:O-antigen/teichoic acid export membrane protein